MILHGDSIEVLKTLSNNSIDSLVTDPPAGINFMGKSWDDYGSLDNFQDAMKRIFEECFRVMKPGAHGLVWAIPRTSHHTAMALERCGFEIRDVITHLFGTGFPKSLNVTKQIEKGFLCQYLDNAKLVENKLELIPVVLSEGKTDFVVGYVVIRLEAEKELPMGIGVAVNLKEKTGISVYESMELTDLSILSSWKNILAESSKRKNKFITLTELKTIIDLKIWNLLLSQNTLENTITLNGTSLKPASEHWILIRKPLEKGLTIAENVLKYSTGAINIDGSRIGSETMTSGGSIPDIRSNNYENSSGKERIETPLIEKSGRWPANIILDEQAAEMLDEQSGLNASRFFYIAKASKSERNAGLEGMPEKQKYKRDGSGNSHEVFAHGGDEAWQAKHPCLPQQNIHPTVKSLALMEYLITLITPPSGAVLDPFMGSGSTGCAAVKLGFEFIGIERESEYVEIATKRIEYCEV